MDTPLSPAGSSMARELGETFKMLTDDDSLKVDHIFVSPYLRCLQTAQPVAQAVNCKMKIEPGIIEFPAGSIMGKPEWDDHDQMLLRQSTREHIFPIVMEEDHTPLYTPEMKAEHQPEGEHSPEQFVTRMIDFVHAWLTTYKENEVHVFVSHNLTLAVIISLLCGCGLKKPMFMAGMMKVASVTRLVEKDDGSWVVDVAMGGSMRHMSSDNLVVAQKQDHDVTHSFYKKVIAWAFEGIDGVPENSVLGCVAEYVENGPMPKRMYENRSQYLDRCERSTISREPPAVRVVAEESPAVQAADEEPPPVQAEESPAVRVVAEESPAIQAQAEESPAVQAADEESPAVRVVAEESPAVQAADEEPPAIQAQAEEPPAVQAAAEESPAVHAAAEEPATTM